MSTLLKGPVIPGYFLVRAGLERRGEENRTYCLKVFTVLSSGNKAKIRRVRMVVSSP